LAEVEICRGCQAISQRDKGLSDEERGRGYQVVLKRREEAHGEQA
jgi:NMD protein affecting ribosome stability and mRNA decay